jgi:1-aminocyclopropane-1-carboxylate deaminase
VVERNTGINLLPDGILNLAAATVEKIDLPVLHIHNITLNVLRLDKIHPVISGNKWFKLKYYIKEALEKNNNHIITFGGAYSNHIVATACVAAKAGLKSTGIIRGEEPATLSHTLKDAMAYGMQLVFISREDYHQKNDPEYIRTLLQKHPNTCIIPEGGEGEKGILGAEEIMNLADQTAFTHLLCAVGTGTLLKGLANNSLPQQQVIGIPVLKGFDNWLQEQAVTMKASVIQRIHLNNDYHFGGYAKNNDALFAFMNQLYEQTNIPTDFVYTGKLLFAVFDLIKKNYFPKGSSLLVVHSGGLQGNRSLAKQILIF